MGFTSKPRIGHCSELNSWQMGVLKRQLSTCHLSDNGSELNRSMQLHLTI
jgi:hypothetical protein